MILTDLPPPSERTILNTPIGGKGKGEVKREEEKKERLKVAFTSHQQRLYVRKCRDGRVALRPQTFCQNIPLSLIDGVPLFYKGRNHC